MLEAAIASFGGLGLIVVDEEGNRFWQYNHRINRLYGLDVDPVSGNIYYGTWHKLIEITRLGNKVWEFSHPKLRDIHAIDVIGPGRILVTSCSNDRVLEIDKKRGIVDEWYVGDHFPKPDLPPNEDWTHLNFVKHLEDGGVLITMLRNPERERGGAEAMRVNSSGEIVWRWSEVSDRLLGGCHALVPFREHYLLGDSISKGIIEVDESGEIYKIFEVERLPHEIEVIDENRILVASNTLGDTGLKPALLWINWDEGDKIVYEPPEDVKNGYSVKYINDWSTEPTPFEEEQIRKRLEAQGYI